MNTRQAVSGVKSQFLKRGAEGPSYGFEWLAEWLAHFAKLKMGYLTLHEHLILRFMQEFDFQMWFEILQGKENVQSNIRLRVSFLV